jgi:hypothetical protein
MLRRRRRQRKTGVWYAMRFPPVELDDAFGCDAEGLEVRANAE